MNLLFTFCLVLPFLFGHVNGKFQSIPNLKSDTDQDVLRKWMSMDQKLKEAVRSTIKWILPYIVRFTSEMDLNPECNAAFLKVILGMRDLKVFAVQMLDSSGKMGGGQLTGTMSAFGDYEGCVAIEVPDTYSEGNALSFRGQYCMVDFRPPIPLKPQIIYAKDTLAVFRNLTGTSEIIKHLTKSLWGLYTVGYRVGLCVPSVCSVDDIDQITNKVANLIEFNSEVVSCEIKKMKTEFDQVELAIIVVLMVIVAIVVIATVIEVWITSKTPFVEDFLSTEAGKSLYEKMSMALSIRANWVKLFKIHQIEDDTLSFLNGIRFLSIAWVVLGHTYLFVDYQLLRNAFTVWDNYTSSFSFQIIGNAFLSVESFLFITGVLISYNLVKAVDAKGNRIFNVPVIIIHRIWRLLPSAMVVVGLTILVPAFLGSGPMWNDVAGGMSRNCRNYWWPILLFANNFIPFKDSCLPHTWYIAVDFQLLFVALFFLFIFFKKPIAGNLFNAVITIIGIVSAALMTYFKEYPPGTIVAVADKIAVDDITNHTYFLPHVHLGVYAAGLTLGAYLARNKDIHVSKKVQVIGWTCAVLCNATILFIVRKWNSGVKATTAESVIYAALHRTGWAVGLTWLTLMCATGRGGYIRYFLSWRGYSVLNRLTYLVYLVHITVYSYFLGNLRGNMDVTHVVGTWAFLGNLMVSFLVAFVLRLLFEAPVLELENLFFRLILRLEADAMKQNVVAETKSHDSEFYRVEIDQKAGDVSPNILELTK